MPYSSLSHFIRTLEHKGELVRVKEYVSPRLEIPEIADRMVKHGGKAILFENTGTPFPLLINAFASDRRICLALGTGSLEDISHGIMELADLFMGARPGWKEKLRMIPALTEVASWMPSRIKGRGACQQVVMDLPDLDRLPVLTCWPADGGPFITLPAVHTTDPVTGARNLGMYRMQVFAPDMTGMHWHLHKGSAAHFRKYRELGRRMPVTVTLGGDPAYTYAATAPLPENVDEYLLAGFLRKKRVEMVRCLTNDLEVPADVDFVIEGYVDPSEEMILEGPFGDHTGFYSLPDFYPRFHVTCITHRRDAVYPATLVGIPPQEDGWIGKATEMIFKAPIRMTVAPELSGMHMPVEGVFHNIVLAAIDKSYPGQAPKTMNALWGAGQMMFNKIMVVTGPDTDLTDYRAVARVVSERTDPVADIHFQRGPVDILDHASSRFAYGSKIGFDATAKLPEEVTGPVIVSGDPYKAVVAEVADSEAIHPAVTRIDDQLQSQG
ncbi:MAG TPA: menaquinone biosynthesis decarboxylase, partial [Bacteroidales bacterium]|nr:menaquinone biosynthesis decarboxylase [Bacteroidales bacterium]